MSGSRTAKDIAFTIKNHVSPLPTTNAVYNRRVENNATWRTCEPLDPGHNPFYTATATLAGVGVNSIFISHGWVNEYSTLVWQQRES